MTSRWLRGTAFAALVVVLAAAVTVVLSRERRIRATDATANTIERTAGLAVASAYDVRTALQGYVAAAQSAEWWQGRFASHVESLRRDLGTLRQLATDPGALNDLDAASASLDMVAEVDNRALQLALADRKTEASLLVFSEGFDAVSSLLQRIDSARSTELLASRARVAADRRWQVYAAGTAALAALLVAALLVPTGQTSPAPVEDDERQEATAEGSPATADPEPAEDLLLHAPSEAVSTADPETHGPEPDKSPALRAAADLCTDFARVSQATEVQGLLVRAADLLDASGLIVWLPDAGGDRLRPSLAHGYSAAALARLPVIDREADNATALSYRRSEPHVVEGQDGSPGALVVPLLTASGCVGVLAAEVRDGREASDSTRDLARLVAAQISTLIGGGDPAREEVAPGHQAAG